jgi:ferrous iron transport protein B
VSSVSLENNDTNALRIAIVGNPNSGKSTLFNAITGFRQKTGNYPGVTVEKKSGFKKLLNPLSKKYFECEFTDLPGTYSLYPKSLDESVAAKVVLDEKNENHPDIILLVLDASNLKRNLLLASQVIDLGHPTLVALNMIDISEELGYKINIEILASMLGVPVVPINSRKKRGIDLLENKIFEAAASSFFKDDKYQKHYTELLGEDSTSENSYFTKLLSHFTIKKSTVLNNDDVIKFEYKDNLDRFKKINEIWGACVTHQQPKTKKNITQKLDDILLHRFLGPLIFLFTLFIIFQSVFYIAEFPMSMIETIFSQLSSWLKDILPTGKFSGLLTDGIVTGLSGIVVFVPQIALLFGFLALLEDSGYMARVTVIMDKLMRGIGLNGRSVIPLISGVACAVPSIMGTRTIPNWRERLITIMVTPLISCSARLPVFTLLISLMVSEESSGSFFNTKGLWLMGLYLAGFFAAVLVALILKFIIKSKEKSYFIMELPVYRRPQWNTVFFTVLEKIKVFVWEAGKVIMVISIVLWLLKSFGPGEEFKTVENRIIQNNIKLSANKVSSLDSDKIINENAALNAKILELSYAGHLGRMIEPAIKPLGFDWKIGISLITSFAAREVFVGTMATIYSSTEEESTLRAKISQQKDPVSGKKIYTYATCCSLLIFYLFALQCMSTIAIVKRETKSWKWPIVQFIYMGAMAWLGSFITYSMLS